MDRTVTVHVNKILEWILEADKYSYGTDVFYKQMFSLIEPVADKEIVEYVDLLTENSSYLSPKEATDEYNNNLGNLMCLRRTYSIEPTA